MSHRLWVGFVGLGDQGGSMARRIIEAGFPVSLYARRKGALDAFRAPNVAFARSPTEMAASSDVVCICVVDDGGVRDVVDGEDGVLRGLRPGGIVVVHSTIGVETCRELARRARECGGEFLDVAVSNRIPPGGGSTAAQNSARAGAIVAMVGGDAGALAHVTPVLETFADPILHFGGPGYGMLAKLLNNLLFYANEALAHDALALGEQLGLDPGALVEALRHGGGRSFALSVLHPDPGPLDLAQRASAMRARRGAIGKDIGAARRLVRDGSLPGALEPAARRALELFSSGGAAGPRCR